MLVCSEVKYRRPCNSHSLFEDHTVCCMYLAASLFTLQSQLPYDARVACVKCLCELVLTSIKRPCNWSHVAGPAIVEAQSKVVQWSAITTSRILLIQASFCVCSFGCLHGNWLTWSRLSRPSRRICRHRQRLYLRGTQLQQRNQGLQRWEPSSVCKAPLKFLSSQQSALWDSLSLEVVHILFCLQHDL